ncbi:MULTISPECIES: hypothetical protein [unclassified Sphingomonas]|uniref:hypothetical protein n=1 Tax=unclassified Sphingomonas TaxID=196159 RepID=UPI0006FC3CF1|nr:MULTISPECIES: hypothetical protein [unclassified Sphingomonas]KQX25108.1 hypothetical protein ASD17_23865 [Sphingomonas sp. Root1294]KQY66125.1 hypothetical protein ASD39_13665 [Sphingomonas sp. Root50]KRB89708.1 hypothetical protein ASE22_18930 [Sphingomonas sp. Root720]
MATVIVGNPPDGGAVSESSRSAVSWPSIFAGAIVAIAATMILMALGSGLGFAAASPWPGAGPSVTTFAIGAGIWLIVMQWVSAALGGYVTGRLRTRWTGVHTDEVLFRDTAHGLLAWAVATVIVAGVALGATASTLNAATDTASAVGYATDTMLRSDRPADRSSAATRAEIARLLGRSEAMAANDRAYLAQLVARQTGLSTAEAQQRIDTATTSIREAADKARKVSSSIGFFAALSMIIGAFIASVAAAYGGRLRDEDELRQR